MLAPEVAQQLKACGLIAIIRGTFSRSQLREVAHALVAGGVEALEVTLNTPDALQAIAELRQELPSALVGAGTVRSVQGVNAALDAGAQFLIAPGFDPASVSAAQQRGALLVPGVFTASEAQAAANAGCRLLKLFPADALGPSYLRALRAPLDDLEFVPTGGISPENLGEYIRAGAVALGVGSALVREPGQNTSQLELLAQAFVKALRISRGI